MHAAGYPQMDEDPRVAANPGREAPEAEIDKEQAASNARNNV